MEMDAKSTQHLGLTSFRSQDFASSTFDPTGRVKTKFYEGGRDDEHYTKEDERKGGSQEERVSVR
jgi:hypothetical protein